MNNGNVSGDISVVPKVLNKNMITRQFYDEESNTYKIEVNGKEDVISYDAENEKIHLKYYDIEQVKIFDDYRDVISEYQKTRHVRIKEGRFMNFLINNDLG